MFSSAAERLAALPKAAAAALERAIADPESSKASQKLIAKALEAVEFPAGPIVPLANTLTLAQRAAAELISEHDRIVLRPPTIGRWLPASDEVRARLEIAFALPVTALNRRRWLGLAPPGPLDEPLTFVLDGMTLTEPAWHALQVLTVKDEDAASTFFDALPIERRLPLLGDLGLVSYALDNLLGWHYERCLSELGAEGASWAPAYAERLLAEVPRLGRYRDTFRQLKWLVFVALVRAKVAIKPHWDRLLPLSHRPEHQARMVECVGALQPERRLPAILTALGDDGEAAAVESAILLLPEFPSSELTAAALDHCYAETLPRALERLRPIAEKHPPIASALAEFLAQRSAAVGPLSRGSSRRPDKLSDLDAVERAQLVIAGLAYDGRELTAAARLQPGDEDTGSFLGALELVAINDAAGNVVYQAVLPSVDSGTIFRAGMTQKVASIIQMKIGECKNPRLLTALKTVFGEAKKAKKPNKKR